MKYFSLLFRFFKILLICYICVTGYFYFFQDSFLYHPDKKIVYFPDASGLEFESCTVETSDGFSVTGWFIPYPSASGLIIYFHGNSLNMSHFIEKIRLYHNLGYSVFTFDYRGYGNSTGVPSEKGTQIDSLAVLRYLTVRTGFSTSEIIYAGHSLGGAVALQLACAEPPLALIIENTFSSVPDMANEIYPYIPAGILIKNRYDNISSIRKITCPVLVIMSTDDELIPPWMGETLYQEAAGHRKQLLKLRGSHNDSALFSWQDFQKNTKTFLNSLKP